MIKTEYLVGLYDVPSEQELMENFHLQYRERIPFQNFCWICGKSIEPGGSKILWNNFPLSDRKSAITEATVVHDSTQECSVSAFTHNAILSKFNCHSAEYFNPNGWGINDYIKMFDNDMFRDEYLGAHICATLRREQEASGFGGTDDESE